MSIDVNRLSGWAQKQIAEKLQGKPTEAVKAEKRSKLGNVKTESGGITFDSKREANRFAELLLLLQAGAISELRLQHNITLIEGYTTPDGVRVKPMVYKADFTYFDAQGRWIVEDAKGHRTRTYLNKKKLLQDKRGITITEV